jgi:hypothetical protein
MVLLSELEFNGCLARLDTVPFYRIKGTVYNTWFTVASTPYFWTNLTLQGSRAACIITLNCTKGHNDVLSLQRPPRGYIAVEVMQIPIRALMHA